MSSPPVVLYVEDDPNSCEIMRLTLSEVMGLTQFTILEDSHDFLSRVQQLAPTPDIVLLDIHVKPLNGFEMLDLLRNLEVYRRVPIVALTASVMNEELQRLKAAGFSGVIAKPIDIDVFPSMLAGLVRGEHIWHIAG